MQRLCPARGAGAAFDYGHHGGRIELRAALAAYLARARGVRADPARIVITQGFTQALDLLCRVLADRGATTLAMESPSHPELRTVGVADLAHEHWLGADQ